MVFIETGIKNNFDDIKILAKKENGKIIHIPALEVLPLPFQIPSENFDAFFFGSSRAVFYSLTKIKPILKTNKNISLLAVGQKTAKALEKESFRCHYFNEDNSGAFDLLKKIEEMHKGVFPFQKILWISARETAIHLKETSSFFKTEIVHLPVYKTIPSKNLERSLSGITETRHFFIRSGKGMQAIKPYLKQTDTLSLTTESAKKHF